MRAKRSKKYRKLMHQYELTFGFREPYQVLVDSNFLRAVYHFKMDLIPALERTLQGQVKPLLTKCSLATIMASQPINTKTNKTVRPDFLPPPTSLPLRHCSHNEDSTPIDEASCLLTLLSPLTDVKRNKEHYILATADPEEPKPSTSTQGAGTKRKREADNSKTALRIAQTLRRGARSIPGVPIVYVKRSVMILEPMSVPSDNVREGVEQDKFRVGLNQDAKRGGDGEKKKEKKGTKKAKGPNPLSVKKAKPRVKEEGGARTQKSRDNNDDTGKLDRSLGDGHEKVEEGEDATPKAKRRRRHHKGAKQAESGEEPATGKEPVATAAVDAMGD